MTSKPNPSCLKWVIAYSKNNVILGFVDDVKYVFDSIGEANYHKPEVLPAVQKLHPELTMANLHVLPQKEIF